MTLVRYNQRTKMMLRFAKHESTIDVPNQINARIEIGEEAVDRHLLKKTSEGGEGSFLEEK